MRGLLVVVLLTGCAKTVETPPGPLRAVTFKRTGPAPTATAGDERRWSSVQPVCDAPPFGPAMVRVAWTTAGESGDAWVTKLELELVTASDALVVDVVPDVAVGGASLLAGSAWLDVADVQVKCERSAFRFPKRYSQRVSSMLQVRGDGRISNGGQAYVEGTQVK